jgi:Leucine-rich repeat (LRR) protein
VTDLTPLANLRWLTTLVLSGSAVTDLGPLGGRVMLWIRKPHELELWNDAWEMRIR